MSEYKVLIPLDGSPMAEHALAFLPALTRLGELNVTLVSVTDIPEDIPGVVGSEDAEREHNLLVTYLHDIAAELETGLGITAHAENLRGPAATRILETVDSASPQLVLLSTHGRSGIARFRRGAVADKVIRGVNVPALVVGPKAVERGKWLEAKAPAFERILVPLDGSEAAESALAIAQEYADKFDAQLHLFRVVPYIPLAAGFWQTPATLGDRATSAATDYLSQVAGRLDGREKVTTGVAIGAPEVEIDTYVRANNIDLVVMSSQGRGGLARAALGSVTDRVIGAGPPVLVVRARSA